MQRREEYDYLLKFAVFGADELDSLKRSLIINFSGQKLSDGLDYNIKTIQTVKPDLIVKLQLWHAVNESLRPVDYPPTYLRGLHGALILFNTANPDLISIRKYFDLIKRYYASSDLQPSIAIVGISSDLSANNSRNIESFAAENQCLYYDNLQLSSQADEELLFQKLTRLHLHKLGVNGIDQPELVCNTNAQHTDKARHIWSRENLSADEKIIAILDDYTGSSTNGLARLFSFITNWNKSHVQTVAGLCNDFRQKKLTVIGLLEQLNNIRIQDVNDPIICIRKFLHEVVMQSNVAEEKIKLEHH